MPHSNPWHLGSKQTLLVVALLICIATSGILLLTHPSPSPSVQGNRAARIAPNPAESVIASAPVTLTAREKSLLSKPHTVRLDKESTRERLLAQSKLEKDPLTRARSEQAALIATGGAGRLAPIQAGNDQARSVKQAIREKKHPERLNAMIPPAPFSPETYKAEPKEYLSVSEPGRVFQTRPASDESAPRIESLSRYYHQVRQGESVALAVKAAPHMPVTFTAFDGGSFSNHLPSITVKADDAGVASTRYVGNVGVAGLTRILASSPASTGKVRFQVNTLVPVSNK